MNQPLHASLFKCTPAESTHGNVSSPSSTHKVVPSHNFRKRDSTKALREVKIQLPLWITTYCTSISFFKTVGQASAHQRLALHQSKGSYQGFLAAASCLLQTVPRCRVVSTAMHSPTDFPPWEMALQHNKSQLRLPPYQHTSVLEIAFNLMAPKYAA